MPLLIACVLSYETHDAGKQRKQGVKTNVQPQKVLTCPNIERNLGITGSLTVRQDLTLYDPKLALINPPRPFWLGVIISL
jgi:hypothetical protein